jgi:hypothetical protein
MKCWGCDRKQRELVITVYAYRESWPIGADSTEIPIQARAQRGIEDVSECREWNFNIQMQRWYIVYTVDIL